MNDLLDHDQVRKIAILNDAFRTTFLGGTICVTAGVHELGTEFVKAALLAVRHFQTFSEDNDPHGEHDFGNFIVGERKLYWKIDYFDPTMSHRSRNPADSSVTRRIMTIMLADEY